MPTYKNVTNQSPILEGKIVKPGQIVHSLSYQDEDAVGLVKIEDKPYYNPILLSVVLNSRPCEIDIPKKDNLGKFITKYSLHFYVESGNVKIYYNSPANNPPLTLYTGAKWNVRHFERHVEKLIIAGMGEFVLYVIVEKLP